MIAASHPHIDVDMAERIGSELRAIETEHGVRILLAVESGSRAWRFPSRDSDYDVRFIYVRPLEDYLSVTPRRDVIERPVDAVLDVSGWDIRKALRLLLKSGLCRPRKSPSQPCFISLRTGGGDGLNTSPISVTSTAPRDKRLAPRQGSR